MITLVLPCLNEERSLGPCIEEAQNWAKISNQRIEIIVADNGSSDCSIEIAKQKGARVVNVPVRGYGAALDAGIREARFNHVVMADSDFSYRLDHIGLFQDALEAGADLVVGNRFEGVIHPGAMPWKNRHIGNPILSFLARSIYKVPIRDFHCGIRAVRKDSYLAVAPKSLGMEYATEMILKFAKLGLVVAEVPTDLRKDLRGRAPHLRPWRDGLRHLMLMLMFNPKRTLVAPASILTFLFFALMIWILASGGEIVLGSIQLSIASLVLSSILGSSALLIGGLGLVMDSIASSRLGIGKGPASTKLGRIGSQSIFWSAFLGSLGLTLTGVLIFVWAQVDFTTLDRSLTLGLSALSGFLIASAVGLFTISLFSKLLQYVVEEF